MGRDIEGDATRPCGNMKNGSCVILGMVHDMLPTFEKNGQRGLPEWKITAEVYTGDVANRRKGTLCVRSYK